MVFEIIDLQVQIDLKTIQVQSYKTKAYIDRYYTYLVDGMVVVAVIENNSIDLNLELNKDGR